MDPVDPDSDPQHWKKEWHTGLGYTVIAIQSQTGKETDHKYHESTEKIVINRPKNMMSVHNKLTRIMNLPKERTTMFFLLP